MFGWKNRAIKAEEKAECLRFECMMAEMRLAQYDELMRNLKRYDHFRFNSGGGIVAYNKDENEMFGTGYVVPDERFRCKLVYP